MSEKKEQISELAVVLKNLGLDKEGVSLLTEKARLLVEYQEYKKMAKRPA